VGRTPGQETAVACPASLIEASGPLPPENFTETLVAAGATVPSARRCRVVSTGVQEPSPRWTRTGRAELS
jgi:hypothetical protein